MQDLAAACEGSFRATGFGSSVVFDLKSKEHRAVAIGEDWQSGTAPYGAGVGEANEFDLRPLAALALS